MQSKKAEGKFEEGRDGLLLCLGWGISLAAHRCLETVKDGSQARMQEGGKEREGRRAMLGKSEGGGGSEGGREGGSGKIVKCVLRNLIPFNALTQ